MGLVLLYACTSVRQKLCAVAWHLFSLGSYLRKRWAWELRAAQVLSRRDWGRKTQLRTAKEVCTPQVQALGLRVQPQLWPEHLAWSGILNMKCLIFALPTPQRSEALPRAVSPLGCWRESCFWTLWWKPPQQSGRCGTAASAHEAPLSTKKKRQQWLLHHLLVFKELDASLEGCWDLKCLALSFEENCHCKK